MTAARHFSFDLTGALAEQLDSVLPSLIPAPLILDELELLDTAPGIYQLYLDGDLVYIGKADESLRSRLTDHYRKISGRLNISVADIAFTGIYLEGTWIPVGPEQMLIKRRESQQGFKPPWNTNGFGINDPGKERDTTNFDGGHFDVVYPVNLNCSLEDLTAGTYSVNKLLPLVKRDLPYIFRYENRWARHPDYLASEVHVTRSAPSAAEFFEALIDSLPAGWQITALPGYVIMYKNIRPYPSARRLFVAE